MADMKTLGKIPVRNYKKMQRINDDSKEETPMTSTEDAMAPYYAKLNALASKPLPPVGPDSIPSDQGE